MQFYRAEALVGPDETVTISKVPFSEGEKVVVIVRPVSEFREEPSKEENHSRIAAETIEELVGRITEENRHLPADFGPSRGNEGL